jgi:SH2 domain
MNDFVEELTGYRKFVDKPEDDVDDDLKKMKARQPSLVPYALCWADEHPGYASLRFVSTSTPRNHLIGITPSGFTWGKTTFSSLDKLINTFKKSPGPPSSKAAPIPLSAANSSTTPKGTSVSRWGAKPTSRPPPPPVPPPPPPMPDPQWDKPQPPPLVPAVGGHSEWRNGSVDLWSAAQNPLPPAYTARPPPPPVTQPTYNSLPPPPMPRPPPPGPPPFERPPPPPGPPAFTPMPNAPASQGRGRGRTLPAWMQQSG